VQLLGNADFPDADFDTLTDDPENPLPFAVLDEPHAACGFFLLTCGTEKKTP